MKIKNIITENNKNIYFIDVEDEAKMVLVPCFLCGAEVIVSHPFYNAVCYTVKYYEFVKEKIICKMCYNKRKQNNN